VHDPKPNAFYHSNLGIRSYDLYNQSVDQNGIVKGDIDFYVSCAKELGGSILELATGTGRVLLPSARAGFAITGVDISAHMLDQARRKLAFESPAVKERVCLCQMDMASFEFEQYFRLALVPFRAFHHLTVQPATAGA
jgi:ubiquinone/menaquinone biosynthesis C-methylase UbiE